SATSAAFWSAAAATSAAPQLFSVSNGARCTGCCSATASPRAAAAELGGGAGRADARRPWAHRFSLILVALCVAAEIAMRGENLPGHVVAVLLRIEDAPAFRERLRNLRAQNAGDARVAVRDMQASDLVVAVVLETARSGQARIDGCGRVATLRQDANRRRRARIAEVDSHVEEERRVECVALHVQHIAGIFDEDDVVPIVKGDVVQSGMLDIAAEEEREHGVIGGRAQSELLN